MSRQLTVRVCTGGQSAKQEESAVAAVGGESDTATASARFDDFSDDDLLALYQERARGSRERTAACEVLVSRCVPLMRGARAPTEAAGSRPRT